MSDEIEETGDLTCVCGWKAPVCLSVEDAEDGDCLPVIVSFLCPMCGQEFELLGVPESDEVEPNVKDKPN